LALGAAVEGLDAFALFGRDLFILGVPMASGFLDGEENMVYLFELPVVSFK